MYQYILNLYFFVFIFPKTLFFRIASPELDMKALAIKSGRMEVDVIQHSSQVSQQCRVMERLENGGPGETLEWTNLVAEVSEDCTFPMMSITIMPVFMTFGGDVRIFHEFAACPVMLCENQFLWF